jgi:hypothetical protein
MAGFGKGLLKWDLELTPRLGKTISSAKDHSVHLNSANIFRWPSVGLGIEDPEAI